MQQNSKKRSANATGVKALIATASVAVTLAGWALLPTNDPQAATATVDQPNQQTTYSAQSNSNSDSGTSDFSPQQAPDIQESAATPTPLPQVQPQFGASRRSRPFTTSHSSR